MGHPVEGTTEFFGTLDTYWETGYEGGVGIILADFRGDMKIPIPDHPGETFQDIHWAVGVHDGIEIEIYAAKSKEEAETEGCKVEVPRVRLTKDRRKMAQTDYRYFVPNEIPYESYLRYIKDQYVARVWKPAPAPSVHGNGSNDSPVRAE